MTTAPRMDAEDGQILFREGEPRQGVWVIAEGSVSLSRGSIALARLNSGARLGEEGEGVWDFTATAQGRVRLTRPTTLPTTMAEAGEVALGAAQRLQRGVARLLTPDQHLSGDLLDFQPDLIELEERPAPRAAEWSLFAIIAAIVFSVLWASLAEVDRVVTAEGRLITTAGKMVVQPLETGVVRSIRVKVGQPVRQGEVLATLDATFTEADANTSRNSLVSLDAQLLRLEAELSGQMPQSFSPDARENALQADLLRRRQAEIKANLAAIDGEIGALSAELNTNLRDQKDAEKALRIAREVEDMRRRLVEKDAGSKLQLLEAQNRVFAAERDINHSANTAQQVSQRLAAAREKRIAYLSETQSKATQEVQSVRRERDKVSEDLKKQDRRSSLVTLTAPVDAVILEVAPRSVGSVASQAEPLITMIPLDAPLEAEVDIPTLDVALLRTGDSARIKLEALPYQRHGILEGRVDVVSGDVLKAEKSGPMGQQASVYRARLALLTRELRNVPPDFRLIPGMAVTAEIKIGTRRVITYFIYPLFRALDESFREP
ncbi:HlyD family secretion protein [Paramagnetospirillum magnetotacticum MS-1]|uniref:Membrane fusion protein (MFP) family protein n=1 Tax=Paramagnetospirillum magnetotacticum MS-1 TaxID=272627 RepID=A0A0C2YLR0_PARME|nr:HlyD family type I secretion periplasmic adaptor subunit [Paramagnetospirillum magnetotacticum]KIM00740.1 HlyD family secretion protein [Paramagnetospirillum magnetotacticum MS-1]